MYITKMPRGTLNGGPTLQPKNWRARQQENSGMTQSLLMLLSYYAILLVIQFLLIPRTALWSITYLKKLAARAGRSILNLRLIFRCVDIRHLIFSRQRHTPDLSRLGSTKHSYTWTLGPSLTVGGSQKRGE